MAQIRACTSDDIPAIAALFQKTFRDPQRQASASLISYLDELFLHHPWHDPELSSKVFVRPDSGVGGFIGVLPLRMSFRGRPVRAAAAGSLMVDHPEENPLAGARLLRSFVAGPQDLSVSETANALSRRMWHQLGGEAVPGESMDWFRIFHPAGFSLIAAGRRFPPIALLGPIAAGFDWLADRTNGFFRLDEPAHDPGRDADVDDDTLLRHMIDFAAGYSLRPQWDPATLKWLVSQAARKQGPGTLFRRAVYGRDGAALGCYLYYGGARRLATVLQIFARPGAAGAVVDSLLVHARRNRNVGVRGRVHPRLLDALQQRRCLFVCRSATVMHTRDAELTEAIRRGDDLMIGLAGESWTRLVGDDFV
jgi:hypothetical protein